MINLSDLATSVGGFNRLIMGDSRLLPIKRITEVGIIFRLWHQNTRA